MAKKNKTEVIIFAEDVAASGEDTLLHVQEMKFMQIQVQ